jgi:hypothetical protein
MIQLFVKASKCDLSEKLNQYYNPLLKKPSFKCVTKVDKSQIDVLLLC